jgi:L-ascorbate metabolism protein UlaG (beta-lactamase superfamily)
MKLITNLFLFTSLLVFSQSPAPKVYPISTEAVKENSIDGAIIQDSLRVFKEKPTSDVYPTKKGDLIIQPLLHATLALEWNNKIIYIDPYDSAKVFEGLNPPDLILITDIHGDHLNEKTLDALDTKKSKFIVPQSVADKISKSYQDRLIIINNGEETKQLGIKIKAIPMYNLPENDTSKHIKGRGNGYILNFAGTKVYISGDTEDIKEMRALKKIDIAFVCMNLPYTMDIDQAASAVLDFKPKIVYPYHYRGKPGLSDVEVFKELVKKGDPEIIVELRDWYTSYE